MPANNVAARLCCALALALAFAASADEITLNRTIDGADAKAPFSYISAMAVQPDGTLLLLDSKENALVRLGTEPSRLSLGEGGLFGGNRVQGITSLEEGRVALAIGSEVRFMGADGKVSAKLSDTGEAEGHVGGPSGLAWSAVNRRFYVADRQYNRISVFGPDGVFLQQFAGSKSMPLDSPDQIYVDRRERIYAFNRNHSGTINIFESNYLPLRQLLGTELRKNLRASALRMTAMTVDPATGLLYLGDSEQGHVYVYDWERDRVVASFGTKGTQRGQFSEIAALALLPDGQLAVADNGARKIEIYSLPATETPALDQARVATASLAATRDATCNVGYAEGDNFWCFREKSATRLDKEGQTSLALKEITAPVAAAFDAERVAVIDKDRLKLFSRDGALLFDSGANQTAPRSGAEFGADKFDSDTDGKFDKPTDLYLRNDRVYVVDRGNRRVQLFTSQGLYVDKLVPAKGGNWRFDNPVAIAVDGKGRIFVADTDQLRVLVFGADKRFLYALDPGFSDIFDLDVDTDDQLYILGSADGNRAKVAVFRDKSLRFTLGARSSDPAGLTSPTSISISRSGPTTVSVYDRDRKRLVQYAFRQVPPAVEGVEVAGSTGAVRIVWRPASEVFVRGYQVFAANAAKGPWQAIGESKQSELSVEAPPAEAAWYRVAAVSDYGVPGPTSSPVPDRFREGYIQFKAGHFPEAAAIFTKLHESDPRHADALRFLGLSLMEQGQWDPARRLFAQLAALPEHEAIGLELEADALERAGELVDAKKTVDRLIATKHASQATYRRCGTLSLALDDAIGAVECLETAADKDPADAQSLLLLGRAYVAVGAVDKGRSALEKARNAAPKNAEIFAASAQVEEGIGDNARAVALYDQALALDPENQSIRLSLAQALLKTGAKDRVRNLALELTQHEGTVGNGYYLLGITSLSAEKYGDALIDLTKATRAAPKLVPAWLALARAYDKTGKQDKRRDSLAKAAAADDHSFDAAVELGRYDLEHGNAAAAAPMLKRAADLNPKSYEAQTLAARALLQTGEMADATDAAAAARRLEDKKTEPLVLLADISARQGKTGAAIGYLKQALEKEKTSYDIHLRLGRLYLDNNMFEPAKGELQQASLIDATKAEPRALLGQLHLKRRAYDEAIASLEKALALDPSDANRLLLDTAYAERKRSLEFASNAPPVVLRDLELYPVFSAAYKQYADNPVGSVRVENAGKTDLGNLKLTFTIKGYMDFPVQTEIPLLKANSIEKFTLKANFNNKVLEVDEDTGVQVEVALGYTRDGKSDTITLTQPMTLYGKNAIVWAKSQMIGAFVTPKDDTLRDFVRGAVNAQRVDPGPLNKNLVNAMTVFSAFSVHGVRYVTDPNAPYSKLAENQIDYVQFARETLKVKSGDCDDLTVLFSAALENLGIETAAVDVPGHLFMMFDTGLKPEQADVITSDPDLVAIYNDHVWIPLETTMIATSFSEAWTEGARKYREQQAAGHLTVIPIHEAWKQYMPVTLKPAGYDLPLPAADAVAPLVRHDLPLLLERSLERVVAPYRAILTTEPGNRAARMQMAIIYARNGLEDKALVLLDELAAAKEDATVHNNRGNLYLQRGDFNHAVTSYLHAEQMDPRDPRIKLNLAIAYYRSSNIDEARRRFNEAVSMDGTVATEYAGFAKLLGR